MEISENEWKAWLVKGQAQERRRAATRWTVGKWIVGLGLIAGAAVYSDGTPYATLLRCMAALVGVVVIYKALQPRLPVLAKGRERS